MYSVRNKLKFVMNLPTPVVSLKYVAATNNSPHSYKRREEFQLKVLQLAMVLTTFVIATEWTSFSEINDNNNYYYYYCCYYLLLVLPLPLLVLIILVVLLLDSY